MGRCAGGPAVGAGGQGGGGTGGHSGVAAAGRGPAAACPAAGGTAGLRFAARFWVNHFSVGQLSAAAVRSRWTRDNAGGKAAGPAGGTADDGADVGPGTGGQVSSDGSGVSTLSGRRRYRRTNRGSRSFPSP
jgi:hypothetical protein